MKVKRSPVFRGAIVGPPPALLHRPATRVRGTIERLLRISIAVLWMALAGTPSAIGEAQPANGGSSAPTLPGPSATAPVGRQVLLLYGDPRLLPALLDVDAALRSVLDT